MQCLLRNTKAFHSQAYACEFVARLRRIKIQPEQHIAYSSADREYLYYQLKQPNIMKYVIDNNKINANPSISAQTVNHIKTFVIYKSASIL